jgi:UDP-3-O-[3-hydroxymyristoyl] N-acetylglucosamine deacetylase/3-hydroxyacyl-[acyl-carrier-protein] dehydratase
LLWLQKTVAAPAAMEGVGLHTGTESRLVLSPAPPNTGFVFRVADGRRRVEIPALVENVAPESTDNRNTSLAREGVTIRTVEHLLGTLMGAGVTNCYLDLDGPEPPVPTCGSGLPYLELIDRAGLHDQGLPMTFYRIQREIRLRDGEVEIVAVPDATYRLSFRVEYDDPLIGVQDASYPIRPSIFREQIAPARTFVMREDVEALRERGLAQGGNLENALVFEQGALAKDQELRFPDEPVRHKILDLLGDLALLGMPIQGHVRARKAGHRANVAFARLLAESERKMARIYPPRIPAYWDIAAVMEIMPHRYPFLLVDRIVDLEPGKRVVGLKNVTINEPFFQGHFPGHPIMPAVLIVEAMAQTGGVLLLSSVDEPQGKLVYFSGIDAARFRRPVVPGDQLRFELELTKLRGPLCKMKGVAYVDEEKVAEAVLMSNIVDS